MWTGCRHLGFVVASFVCECLTDPFHPTVFPRARAHRMCGPFLDHAVAGRAGDVRSCVSGKPWSGGPAWEERIVVREVVSILCGTLGTVTGPPAQGGMQILSSVPQFQEQVVAGFVVQSVSTDFVKVTDRSAML